MKFEEFLVRNFFKDLGIWYSKQTPNEISYPEDGNDACFELEENSFWFRHRNNCLLSVIKKYSPNDLFFDIGGGNGFVTKAIQDAKIEVVLVEPGKSGVINAKSRNVERVICGATSNLTDLSGTISSIGAFDVLEHIENDKSFVKEISDLLKPQGYFYLTLPAFQFLWSNDDDDAGHFRRYTEKSIRVLLEKKGFEIIYFTYIFSILILPLFLLRTLTSKLGIRQRKISQTKNEHTQNTWLVGIILQIIWKWELKRIEQKKKIPFGTSCFLVARKIK